MSTSRTLHPEDQIAQYRVVGPLGAGGMGEVYLAQDQSLERSVALKVLPYELTRSEDRVRRFVQEAKSASSLNHPNIVTIYEIGQEPVKSASGGGDSGPLHYMSMELITGKTLGAKIHEEKTDLKSLVGYLAQAAEGIAKAHAVGIVHRDLKPGNIMISEDGFAKVLDFGLAKLTERYAGPNEATEIADRTSEGAVMGTVSYMAPEQVQGKPVDARSDIFAFGCILYEAATRQRPFTAESNVEIMHKILHEKPRPVEELNQLAPAELRRVIRRCLAKAPEQRAQSMKDIAIELREIFDEYDALSASNTSATQTQTTLASAQRRKRMNLVPVVIVVSAIAVAALAFGWFGLKKGGETDQGTLNMRVSAQTNRGDVIDCAISEDGRFIAYVAGRGGRQTLRVRQVATGSDVEILPVQDTTIEFPSFTPDGNYIFYCKRKPDAPSYRVLMSVPSLGGREQERGFDVDTRIAFAPDGTRACFIRNYPQKGYTALVMLDLQTGKETEFAKIPGPGGPGGPPSWSSDGKHIAVSMLQPPPKAGTTVALFDPSNGERRDFFRRDGAFLGDIAWLPDNTGLAMAGFDITSSLTNQVFMVSYPAGKLRRVTNDLNQYAGVTTASASDPALVSRRSSALANLYAIDVATSQTRALTSTANPENSPNNMRVHADRVYFGTLRGDFLGVSSVPLAGGEPTVYETGDGHVIALRAEADIIVMQRLDPDQQMHVWAMKPDGSGFRQLTNGGGEALLGLSPDGKWVTYAISDSTRGVWLKPTDGGDARLFSPKATPALGGFSPDGKFIATLEYVDDPAGMIRVAIKVAPIEGGEAFELALPQRATDYESVPGSQYVSFIDQSDPNRNLYRVKVEPGGKIEPVTSLKDGPITDHVWSTDGKKLLVARRMADGENVWLLNADGSQPKQLTRFTGYEVQQIDWAADGITAVVSAGQVSNDVVLIRNFK